MKLLSQATVAFSLLSTVSAVRDVVDLGYSKYQGQVLHNGLTQWNGMRYAAAPVGHLRFMPPQDPPHTGRIQTLNTVPAYCFGVGSASNDTTMAEDCLFINVMAPSDATEHSKLPVYFYIQGGGFALNSNPNINASGLIAAADFDMIVVNINYRVGPYGFLTNKDELVPNVGLHDQRKAMEWVQKYIRNFGGDPGHVTMGGSSAGAASAAIHMTAQGGRDLGLFHAVISESASFAPRLTQEQNYYQYKQFVTRLGCTGKDAVACVQKLSVDEIQEQNYDIPLPGGDEAPKYQWEPSFDNDFVTDLAYNAFEEGKFVKVPAIFGDDQNGGTKFCPTTTASIAESNHFMIDQYTSLTPEQFEQINALYPNQNGTCPNDGCYWRQLSDTYGQCRYMCPSLFATKSIASHVEGSYAYLWNVKDPEQEAEGYGVLHTIELAALLGPEYDEEDAPASYFPGQLNAMASPVIQGYWTSFIRTFDPNKKRYHGTATWEPWSDETPTQQARLEFMTRGKTKMSPIDSQLSDRCELWASLSSSMLL